MRKVLEDWMHRYLGDRQAVVLLVLLAIALAVIFTIGEVIAPLIAAIIIAFLLQGSVNRLKHWNLPHLVAVSSVFTLFVGLVLAILVFLAPLVVRQASSFLAEVPSMLHKWQETMLQLPSQYPHIISEKQLASLSKYASAEAARFFEALLSFSVASLPNLIALLIYLILVPLMVFFLLKDKDELTAKVATLFPAESPVLKGIWHEMNRQMANYVRGKVAEIAIVGVSSYVIFLAMGLDFALLLGVLVGLSVVIPYIGAAVVTVPVVMVAYFQWGWSADFLWLFLAYMLIQALDGNLLVPLLFSEAVNLHPLAIILAVLVFGGLWGFWGVFFAIPLATLVKALHNAWPRTERLADSQQ